MGGGHFGQTISAESGLTAEPTSEPADIPNDNEIKESKMLVAYFSGTGTTKALAETIAETTGADIFEIIPSEPYTSADLNYNTDCRANREQNDTSARPAISGSIENMNNIVFLGYPIWWGKHRKSYIHFWKAMI